MEHTLQKRVCEKMQECTGQRIENSVGSEIRVLWNLIHRALENSPQKKMVERISGTNAWIIGYIGGRRGQDVFQRDLERQFGITRSTASKVVNLMVQKGLVERQGVPEDARLKKLVLTAQAWEVFDLMQEDFRGMERALTFGFSQEELEQFFDYIHRMQNNIKMKEERRI